MLAALFLIVALANLAMPGSANFVGEFYILLGVFKSKLVIAIVAFTGVVLASSTCCAPSSARCTTASGAKVESRELSLRDGLVVAPLVLVILALAVYPQLALDALGRRASQAAVGAADRHPPAHAAAAAPRRPRP